MATNALLGLTPEQQGALLAAAADAIPETGVVRSLFASALAPRQWWRVLLGWFVGAVAASWAARRCLRSESETARKIVEGFIRHIVQPVLHVPLQLVGLPTMSKEIVDSFLSESLEARRFEKAGFMHTLPLLVTAFNLHKRLRLILDDGHAYHALQRAGSKGSEPAVHSSHSKAKVELMFLFGEYLAWGEELRRYVHRTSNTSYMSEAREVNDAFSVPLPSEELDEEAASEEEEEQEDEEDGNAATGGHGTAGGGAVAVGSDDSVGGSGIARLWQVISQRFGAVVYTAAVAVGDTRDGDGVGGAAGAGERLQLPVLKPKPTWVEFWLAGVDAGAALPVVYTTRREAAAGQHDDATLTVAPLRRNEVIHIWQRKFPDGTMKLVRDGDVASFDATGTPQAFDHVVGLRPATIHWITVTNSGRREPVLAAGLGQAAALPMRTMVSFGKHGVSHMSCMIRADPGEIRELLQPHHQRLRQWCPRRQRRPP